MYIIKNAWLNISRKKGRNILIGLIIVFITMASSIALVIHKSGSTLTQKYKESNPLEVSFTLNPTSFKQMGEEETQSFTALTVEDIQKYGDSNYVKDYYYTEEATMSSDTLDPVSYEETREDSEEKQDSRGPKMEQMGDFRLTGYSDPSYINEFIAGTKKIKEGSMFTKDETEKVSVISEELATQNEIKVGDEITLYSPSDSDTPYTFKVVGIYEDNSDVSTDGFMSMNAMNSRNQIYTNITGISDIITATGTSSNKMVRKDGLTAKFYLYNNNDLDAFTKEVEEKGLNASYTVTTNEDEILSTVKPIQNISRFSLVFLIIILIVGASVLAIINLINIRERKYEIGVLRAMGMRKSKIALQFITEIFIVAMVSLLIGIGLGTALSQSVATSMLQSEIESYQTQSNQIEENFGSENFERPSRENFRKGEGEKTEYVDTLTVQMDASTILILFLVSIALTLTTSVISILFINRYEPGKILQDR